MSYLDEIPSSQHVKETLQIAFDHWRKRNAFISDMRRAIDGGNPIDGPTEASYKIKTMHTYYLASVLNEKSARFSLQPTVQVVPPYGEDFTEARAESTELELALRSAFYEIERKGDGDVWSKVILDAIALDTGVERIERAPSAFWPEAHSMQTNEALENYKRSQGLPIRTVYVPLENFYPIYEGSVLTESFELFHRPLRAVLSNPLFAGNIGSLAHYSEKSIKEQLTTLVPIVLYCNHQYCAYFMLGTESSDYGWQKDVTEQTVNVANPIMLHNYKHGLGETLYNCVAGRYGGWKTDTNRIEGVGKGLLELSSTADEVASQVLTNVRARYWPTLVHKVDFDRRGVAAGTNPKPINTPEGHNIAIFKDEEIEPIFQATHDEAVVWVMDLLKEQIGRLGGSEALYGMRQPGVETGYHQSLQLSQAEHLDAKIEQHLVQGAIRRATLILQHVKAMNRDGNNVGKVYTTYTEDTKDGKRLRYYCIDHEKLSPLPMFDARVRKPRPVDIAASLRAALSAGDERGGKGPLLSDDIIRSEILGRDEPDIEERRILVESQKRAIVQSGALTAQILKRTNTLLVSNEANQEPQGAVDPVLQNVLTARTQQARASQSGEGNGGGPPAGQSQPEQAAGIEEAALAANGTGMV